jgi:alpha-tubulin suppressor-like RCC1 family protein|tara:strand:- start:2251 stop:3459 length:1209 start_codon:yes stop_codon:yes gene_type:complete
MNIILNKSYLFSALLFVSVIASVPAHSDTLIDIDAGDNHTCMLNSNGKAHCWGNNAVGQLGDGSIESSMTPVAVSGGLKFKSISVGWDHTCGITGDNDAYCWGRGRYGSLGNGSPENSTIPVAVSGDLSFESVDAGLAHTCGITSDEKAFCWGRGEAGILGDKGVSEVARNYTKSKSSSVPVPVSGGIAFGSINAGSATTCGISTNGNAYCWGSSDFGNLLGQGSDTRGKAAPGLVAGDFVFHPNSISVGLDHVCALGTSDKAICWGRGRYGKLGIGSTGKLGVLENLRTPREINGNISFASIATGTFQTCGIATDGQAYCWGRNGQGQLGDGTTTMRVEPVAVSGNVSFRDITIGTKHTCAISSNDEIYCWGDGKAGKLGTRSSDNKLIPTKVRLNRSHRK